MTTPHFKIAKLNAEISKARKMNKYIAVVLINALLLQFTACYSTKYLSKNETNTYYTDETINVSIKDKREFVIKKGITFNEVEKYPAVGFCSDYKIYEDTLILMKNKVVFTNQKDEKGFTIKKFEIDTVKIPADLIAKMSIDQFDSKATWYLASGIITVGLVILLYYSIKNQSNKRLF
jgi:hypothetical protein